MFKKTINPAYLANGRWEQIVEKFECKKGDEGFEKDDKKIPKITLTHPKPKGNQENVDNINTISHQ